MNELNLQEITDMGEKPLQVFNALAQILEDKYQIQREQLDLEKSIFCYGISSLQIIEIHVELEKKLNLEFPEGVIADDSKSLKDLIEDILNPQVKLTYSLKNEIEEILPNLKRLHSSVSTNPIKKSNTTFLTGSSGFVGTFFLKELLKNTQLTVFCLVRASDEKAGLERIKNTAKKYGVKLPWGWERRVKIIIGDMSKSQFGLSDNVYEELTETIDSVYHVAALDNFYYPYNVIKNINVVGTVQVAEFALSKKVKPLYHVSSCASALLEKSPDQFNTIGLVNGYAQTKYVTEQIIVRLAEELELPWVSFRLGYLYPLLVDHIDKNVSFQKLLKLVEKAYLNLDKDFIVESDAFENFLNAVAQMGCIPALDCNFDLTPVEYAAKAIISTSLKPANERKNNYTFYNPQPLNWSDVISAFQTLNRQIKVLPIGEFTEKYQQYIQQTDDLSIRLLKTVVSTDLEHQLNTMFRGINNDVVEELIHWCPPCHQEFTQHYVNFAING